MSDRRLKELEAKKNKKEAFANKKSVSTSYFEFSVWKYEACEYLCSRPKPPENVQSVKIDAERFEEVS